MVSYIERRSLNFILPTKEMRLELDLDIHRIQLQKYRPNSYSRLIIPSKIIVLLVDLVIPNIILAFPFGNRSVVSLSRALWPSSVSPPHFRLRSTLRRPVILVSLGPSPSP